MSSIKNVEYKIGDVSWWLKEFIDLRMFKAFLFINDIIVDELNEEDLLKVKKTFSYIEAFMLMNANEYKNIGNVLDYINKEQGNVGEEEQKQYQLGIITKEELYERVAPQEKGDDHDK